MPECLWLPRLHSLASTACVLSVPVTTICFIHCGCCGVQAEESGSPGQCRGQEEASQAICGNRPGYKQALSELAIHEVSLLPTEMYLQFQTLEQPARKLLRSDGPLALVYAQIAASLALLLTWKSAVSD